MNDMGAILKEIAQDKVIAERDPINYPLTSGGIAAAARQAKERIAELTEKYGDLFFKGAIAIFVDGPKDATKDFAEIADEEDFGAISVDAMSLYRDLASGIFPAVGPRHEFGAHHAGMMIGALRNIGVEMGLTEMTPPRHAVLPVVVNSVEETAEYIRTAMRAGMGDDFNALYLSRKLRGLAMERKLTKPSVAVVVYGGSKDENEALAQKIFNRPTESITVDNDVTKEVVLKHFKNIRAKLKSSKN